MLFRQRTRFDDTEIREKLFAGAIALYGSLSQQ
jgi:hypothetical protein